MSDMTYTAKKHLIIAQVIGVVYSTAPHKKCSQSLRSGYTLRIFVFYTPTIDIEPQKINPGF